MNYTIQYIVLAGGLFIASSFHSQTAIEILKKVNQTYDQKSYVMDYSITGYQVDKEVYHYKGQVAKKGNKQLSKSDYEVTLIDDSYFLHINHERKIIVVNKLEKQKNKRSNTTDIVGLLDSIIIQSNPKLVRSSANEFEIELPQKEDPYYQSIFLIINKKYQLVGVNYFTKTADSGLTKIEVIYKNITVAENISERYFSKEDYVIVSKKNVTAKEQYKTYEIIDQRSIEEMN